jgi:hypothetical protein
VAIGGSFWYAHARAQMRRDLILKLIEGGHSVDPVSLDRMLTRTTPAPPPHHPQDPRSSYRPGAFIYFLMAFGTLAYAFTRADGVSYPLVALGLLPLWLTFYVWVGVDRAFRDGTLPTLKYERDPQEGYYGGAFVFYLIGYTTIFIAIVRDAGLSYPLVGLGLLAILMSFGVLAAGRREYRAGLLTGVPRSQDRG